MRFRLSMRKLLLFISVLLLLTSCIVYQKVTHDEITFKWDDASFIVGAKRIMHIRYMRWDGDSMLDSWTYLSLDTIKDFMKRNPNLKVGIYVHTDPQGQAKHNITLSEARAQYAVSYIISKGIDSARLVPKGMGFSQPLPRFDAASIAKMKTREEKQAAYQADRRTEVVILATDYKASK